MDGWIDGLDKETNNLIGLKVHTHNIKNVEPKIPGLNYVMSQLSICEILLLTLKNFKVKTVS